MANSSSVSRSVPSWLKAALVAAGLSTVVGCGMSSSPGSAQQTFDLQGSAHGGQPPVQFTHVALFATTSSGYNGSVTPLATATTDTSGNWRITGTYSCPSTEQAYVVATGGNPGLATGTDNSALFLVAALGPCSSVSSATVVNIDEVTTVAAAYALSGFLPLGGAGMTEAAVVARTAMPGITTSSTNTQGLKDAFANAANVADTTSGLAYSITPSSANGVAPQATMDALADILQSCVNTTGPSSAGCAKLFTDATPPAVTGIAKPVNVFQAALDIAQFPGNNVAALFSDASSTPAFAPTLSAAPNDWTVGLVYTDPNLVSGTGMGVDASDNVYVAGAGYLINFSAQGAPLTTSNLLANDSAITANDTLREIVFDKSGNLFVTDGNYTGVYEYTPATGVLSGRNFSVAPANDVNANTYGIALDAFGDVFTQSYSKSGCSTASTNCTVVEFPAGAGYAPYSTFSGNTVSQPSGALGGARGMAFDVHTGNLWYTAIDDNLGGVVTLTPSATGPATASNGAKTMTGFGTEVGSPATNTAYGTIAVAVDATSRAWFVVTGGAASTKSGSTTAAIPAGLYPVSAAGVVGTGITGGGLNAPDTIIVDGRNNLFVANSGTNAATSSVVEYSPAAGAFLSPNIGFNPGATYASGALTAGPVYEPSYVSVDRSGALWVLSSGSGSSTKPSNLVQILGVAAPTDPLLENGNYGVKP